MTPQGDAEAVRAFLVRAARRTTSILMLHGATTGFAVALAITAIGSISHRALMPPGVASLGLVALGVVAGFGWAQLQRPRIAEIVEGRAPECRNLLVTASELIEERSRTGPYVSGLVFRDAARIASALELAALFPIRNALVALTALAALWTFAATRVMPRPTVTGAPTAPSTTTAMINRIDVEVTNPAYIGGAPRSLRDPARIEVRAGSRIRLTVRADGDTVTMETIAGRRALSANAAHMFIGEFLADADGYVALEPEFTDGRHGPRRLIGISAIADRPPTVRITTPGRDLKFTDGRQPIILAIAATDDNALASLRLRYTRVAGSGERFTFTDGEVPLTISRVDARTWNAHATWRLDSLNLGPGDMVVYRAVAADARPGAPPAESDSYIAEVLAPGGIAAAGFAIDPEVERYALSEQMVILKTERLLARKPTIAADSFAANAADLAAEQRRVRAEYVFMMGGEVGGVDDGLGDLNEQAEASGEGDLAVQRMLNQGRAALLSAIRTMSRAATSLTQPDLAAALLQEKEALVQLERTFSHTKIILRALTERERLDLTRRLSGTLTDAARDVRPVVAPERNPRMDVLRRALGDIATLAASREGGATASAHAAALAEDVLRVDPSSPAMQQVAAQLIDAAAILTGSRREPARALLDKAATALTGIIRADLLDAPLPATGGDATGLAGSLTDALRHPRGGP